MSSSGCIVGSPIARSKTITVIHDEVTGSGTIVRQFATDTDSVLVSLFVESISGTLDVVVETFTDDGRTLPVITFPQVSAATGSLIIKKAAAVMSNLQVRATHSDDAVFEVRAKGIGAGSTTVTILGANDGRASQKNVTTTPELLIPASLTDRAGMVLKHWAGGGILYLGYSSAETDTTIGFPITPGEPIGIDIAAGAEIWGRASGGTIDVRIMEAAT